MAQFENQGLAFGLHWNRRITYAKNARWTSDSLSAQASGGYELIQATKDTTYYESISYL